jgi:molecular chaperone DnaK (HSP70)
MPHVRVAIIAGFNDPLVRLLAERVRAETGAALAEDPYVAQRLKEASDRLRAALMDAPSALVSLPFITTDVAGAPAHAAFTVTREECWAANAEAREVDGNVVLYRAAQSRKEGD